MRVAFKRHDDQVDALGLIWAVDRSADSEVV
jgi:hypothetical protein